MRNKEGKETLAIRHERRTSNNADGTKRKGSHNCIKFAADDGMGRDGGDSALDSDGRDQAGLTWTRFEQACDK